MPAYDCVHTGTHCGQAKGWSTAGHHWFGCRVPFVALDYRDERYSETPVLSYWMKANDGPDVQIVENVIFALGHAPDNVPVYGSVWWDRSSAGECPICADIRAGHTPPPTHDDTPFQTTLELQAERVYEEIMIEQIIRDAGHNDLDS